ncbi:hypothetical protein HS125_07945 [bacterium]|nr:hypothetical protein [bacterium]
MLEISRPGYHYQPQRDDTALARRLGEIARERKWAGYRTAWGVLRLEGEVIPKRVHRVWRQEALVPTQAQEAPATWEESNPLRGRVSGPRLDLRLHGGCHREGRNRRC